ncbi:MAG: FAD-binding oxidoreductase [Lentisphaeria bacterium]
MQLGTNNIIQTIECRDFASIQIMEGEELAEYDNFLTDESGCKGVADALVFPRSSEEAAAAVSIARERGWPITVSGARTGITAGAVPDGGMVMSLERLDRVLGLRKLDDGTFTVKCQAGVPLTELQTSLAKKSFQGASAWTEECRETLAELKKKNLFFPPDPTETTASVGGITACNAAGAHSFAYGPVRPYVHSLTVVLADGSLLTAVRGQYRADEEGWIRFKSPAGKISSVKLPTYPQPAVKNVAGYYSALGMDIVDLFIGSEGTLGVITEVELRLVEASEKKTEAMIFVDDEESAVDFTVTLRQSRHELGLQAIEYFDPRSLDFMRDWHREMGAASGVPACLNPQATAALYIDLGIEANAEEDILTRLAKLLERADIDPASCWSASENDEKEVLRTFRHALPEAVNSRIAEIRRSGQAVNKLGTDMAVPDAELSRVVQCYRYELESSGLEYVMFGHIGENHLHINIIPRDTEEYAKGRELYWRLAREVVAMGGSPAAEHGTGKLKKEFVTLLYDQAALKEMRYLKAQMDYATIFRCLI